jgi:hypothetical protein
VKEFGGYKSGELLHRPGADAAGLRALALAPDGRVLYVACASGEVLAYPVEAAGQLGKGKMFYDLAEGGAGLPRGGLAVDGDGNVYVARPAQRAVQVVSAAGVAPGRILLPEPPTGCACGGAGARTLYVTSRTALYAVQSGEAEANGCAPVLRIGGIPNRPSRDRPRSWGEAMTQPTSGSPEPSADASTPPEEMVDLREQGWRCCRRNPTRTGLLLVAALVLLSAPAAAGFLLWRHARQVYLAGLRTSAEAAEEVALAQLHADQFESAAQVLAGASRLLEAEPALAALRDRLAEEGDRAGRLARFYQLSDWAERLEAEQDGHVDTIADSGAVAACAAGLAKLGVFNHDAWWEHLPDPGLTSGQRERLREDVYRQLLLLAAVRVKTHLWLGEVSAAREALPPLDAANRFRPESFAGCRMKAWALTQFGRPDKARAIMAQLKQARERMVADTHGRTGATAPDPFVRLQLEVLASEANKVVGHLAP